jgi:O-antigen/teichoic acid export membrane protein
VPPLARYRLLATNASAVFVGRLVSIACGFVLATVLFRALGPRQYGLWSLLTLLASYSTVIDFGLAAAVERRTASLIAERREAAIPSLIGITLMGLALVALAGELLAGLILVRFAHWARANGLMQALLVLPFCTALMLASLATGAVLAGYQQMRSLYFWRSVGVVFGTVAVLAAVRAGNPTLDVLLVTYTSGSLVTLLLVWRALKRLHPAAVVRLNRDTESILELLRFGSLVQLATMVPPAAEYAFRIIVSARFGLAYAGIYDLGSRAAVTPRSVAGALFSAMVPFAVQTDRQLGRPGLSRLIRATSRHTALFMLPVSAILYGFADEITRAWLGGTAGAQQVRVCFQVVLIAHAVGALWVPASMAGRALAVPMPEAVVTFLSFACALLIAQVAPTFTVAAAALWGIPAIGGLLIWMWLTRAIGVMRPSVSDVLWSAAVAIAAFAASRVAAPHVRDRGDLLVALIVVSLLATVLASAVECRSAERRAAIQGFVASLLKT